ncbi:uncharacterized protein [Temnothorax nylanderi]|uniref:uncharacterized protein n=1 Tax=Temnothorax nylanderi TaxID=102681 RepID=UPI003A8AD955
MTKILGADKLYLEVVAQELQCPTFEPSCCSSFESLGVRIDKDISICDVSVKEIIGDTMDKIKKSRSIMRTAFTRILGSLNAKLDKERPDIAELQVCLALISDKASQLEEVNQKIFEVIIASDADEEDLLRETETADEYRMKYQQAKVAHIHEDPNITKEDKFQYLIQAMVKDSRASVLVNSFPPTATNYDKVIASLKSRFGREDLLVEVYVREMLKLVLNQTMKTSSRAPFSGIYDNLETQLRALESLGVTTDMCAAMLYPLVESSLPEDLLRVWQRNPKAINSTTSKQRLDELMSFLHAEVMGEERIAMAISGFGINDDPANKQDKSKKKIKNKPKEIATAAGLLSTKEDKSPSCIFCGQGHESASCGQARKMSYEDRYKVVKTKNACFYCTKTGHSFKYCRYKGKCEWCGKRHLLLMCRNTTSSPSEKDSQTQELAKNQEQSTLANISLTSEVFLQTLCVKLFSQGKERVVRAVFDTESHRSYILDHYAEELGFVVVGEQQIVHMLFGGKLLTGKRKELKCGAVALETLLGWTLIGKVDAPPKQKEDTTLMVVSMFTREENITDLWKLDTLGITDPILKKTEDIHQADVRETFRQTIKINTNGRYEVLLPWKEDYLPLADNKSSAIKRLESTTRRLRTQDLYDAYQQVFEDWLSEGIIEKVPDKEVKNMAYYLPHRSVIKENSTTKIRPVFDASATGENSPSLNHCLETGPNLIEQIPRILLRFRRRKIGITADIRKAFLQISISPEDRDVLRFLWWKKSHPEEMEVYRHRRVVFGVSSSPFLLGATIEYHLKKALHQAKTEKEKEIIRHLMKSFYVDNCVTSVDSKSEATEFEVVARRVMDEGKFDLRGWEYTGEEDKSTSILGLLWDKEQDTLRLTPALELRTTLPVTKRSILSAAQRIFDPIGVSSPISLKPKLLLQKLWSCKINWDNEVPEDVKTDFNNWLQQLHWLKELCIPRCAFLQEENLSFHVFVDASKEAYAAAVFARTETPEGVYVQLILAKSRITPIERITTPRSELLAATIGARSWRSIRNRVKEIRSLSDPNQWHHVPGSLNPADLPSRGCGAKHLVESRWWEGPAWLKLSRDQWPSSDVIENEAEINSEIKKSARQDKKSSLDDTLAVGTYISIPQEEIGWYMKGQSRYIRIIRTMAWIRRFATNCRAQQTARFSGELTTKEFIEAELVVLKLTQGESLTK